MISIDSSLGSFRWFSEYGARDQTMPWKPEMKIFRSESEAPNCFYPKSLRLLVEIKSPGLFRWRERRHPRQVSQLKLRVVTIY